MRISDWSSDVCSSDLTFEEHRGPIAGRTVAWVGDGNNVCASFIHAAPKLGFKLNIAAPAVYHPDLVDLARAAEQQGRVTTTHDPREAVAGADCVITDTWVSMGDTDHDERLEALEPYRVDEALMDIRSEEHTSELQSLMRISYAVFCL